MKDKRARKKNGSSEDKDPLPDSGFCLLSLPITAAARLSRIGVI